MSENIACFSDKSSFMNMSNANRGSRVIKQKEG